MDKSTDKKKKWRKPEIIDLDAAGTENQTGGPAADGGSPPNNRTS